jgi:hypothetical protein
MSWRTPAARARFAELAAAMIPPTGEMPGAADVQIEHDLLNRAMRALDTLEDGLEEVLKVHDWKAEPEQVLRDLHRERPELFESFLVLVSGAYYLEPGVRAAMNDPGQRPQPQTDLEADVKEMLGRVVWPGKPTTTFTGATEPKAGK